MTQRRPILEVAADLGLSAADVEPYGREVVKVGLGFLERPRPRPGRPRLVLVSAITPTPAGEGKTTTTIGLGQAMARLGESVCLALREPSLGPCMGVKGGATGGGRSCIHPADRINLHFTGDFHAITAAHNLLAAAVDNLLHFGLPPRLDPRRVRWRRVLDVNDRALRHVVTGLGGPANWMPRETGFDITAASEVMAAFCLAEGLDDLRARLDRLLVGFTVDRKPVFAEETKVTGAMIALLADAIKPNLVQTTEGVPAFVHGGPFANIAHGCNSVLATRMALHGADWAITEAGFGFDLGAEKFFDIKCRSAGLDTAAVVLVATIRALKMHGGRRLQDLGEPDPGAVADGLPNLHRHLDTIAAFGEVPVVAINRFEGDTDEEIDVVRRACADRGVPCAVSDHFARGGEGALELAELVRRHAERTPSPYRPLYPVDDPLPEKVRKVAQTAYGARAVVFTRQAERDLARIRRFGWEGLPVCIAKTQSSLSDDPKLGGIPGPFDLVVRGIVENLGAGFLVVLTGDILRMPGLPRSPQAERIDVVDGRIVGVR